MRHKLDIAILIGAFAAGAVLSGLAMTGGPGTARAERQDEARVSDLNRLSKFITCVAKNSGEGSVLPDQLSPDRTCDSGVAFNDPVTDAPYGYHVISADRYQLCADFEQPDRMSIRYSGLGGLDADGRCFTLTLPD